jgi:xylan 1,4-beta-xylosidase
MAGGITGIMIDGARLMMKLSLICLFLLSAHPGWSQSPIAIRVNAGEPLGAFQPVYRYFGYDEPNDTYTPDGRKLIGELASLSAAPVYIRTHFLLATGDGAPALKWGSTNAYTEESGKPVYDWTVIDRIFDTYLHAGAKPYVEIGFMPRALSSRPEPYRPIWSPGARFNQYFTGWTYPPADYAKWSELVYRWVRHSVERYGASEVETWYWEVWNEPDIAYWHGTAEDYDKLYDYTVEAVKRALPSARVGGPATTGPSGQRSGGYLRQFLEHCATGRNYATGRTGSPLDFISFHAKGRTSMQDGHAVMDIGHGAHDVQSGFEIIASFPRFRGLPIVLSESDPEGCAACVSSVYPQNAYRNGPQYASYTAAMMKTVEQLAGRAQVNLQGMLTWAFEFENQPYFAGFRALVTNGIDKPILNLFRMAGMMRGERLQVESSGAAPLDSMVDPAVRGKSDVDALASRSAREISVMVWNYRDQDSAEAPAAVRLVVAGLPASARRVLVRHYRIDETHSDAFTAWQQMGSPQHPAPAQYAALEAAGQLQQLDSPRWIATRGGEGELEFSLPEQAVSLVELSW